MVSCTAPTLNAEPCVPVAVAPAMDCPLLAPDALSDLPTASSFSFICRILMPHCTKKTSPACLPLFRYCWVRKEFFNAKVKRNALVSITPPSHTATSENDQPLPIARSCIPLSIAFWISHLKFDVVALYFSVLFGRFGSVNLNEAFFLNLCLKF